VNIGIFIFEGAEELDFTGPYEVLTQWAQQAADEREIVVFTIARSTEPVRCAHGLRVLPDYTLHLVARLDSRGRAESVRRYIQYETPVAV
jgi:putative intracellular protease/amidase